MKKKLISMICVITMVVSMVLTACGKSDSNGESGESGDEKAMIIPIANDISSFYTVGVGDLENEVLSPLYDNLFTVVDGDTVEYHLAKSCEVSDDGLVYTIELVEGAKWDDGEDITADDLVFSMSSEAADFMGYYPYFAASNIVVEKTGEYTATVALERPNNSFFQRIGTCRMMPSHLFEGVSGEELMACEGAMAGVGSGAYKLAEWNKGESIVYEKRDDYYGGEVSIDKVIFKVIPDASAQELAFKNGEVNLLRLTTKDQIEEYEADENCTVFNMPENRVNFLVVNASSTKITSLEARQAVFAALNPQEICDQVYGSDNLAKPAGGMYTDATQYFDTSLANYVYNTDQAKSLAESSGLSGQTVTLLYFTDRDNMEDYAMVIQQQLKAIGVECELVGADIATGMTEFQMGTDKYDLMLNGWDSMQGNPGAQWSFYSTGSAAAYYCFSENTLELLNGAVQALDEAEAEELYTEFQKSCFEDYWAYPLVETNYVLAAPADYEGIDAVPVVPIFADWTKLSVE